MRIIAGRAKGRTITAPPSGTRPMTGRARESLFSIIAGHLVDADVLDLYAGSGGLGLEALSRGARSAVFVERSSRASRIIAENVEAVGLGGTVHQGSAYDVVGRLRGTFDVIFVDPPYRDTDQSVEHVLGRLDALLADTGIVVVHRQASSALTAPEFLTCVDERRYGDAVVSMFERPSS